MTEIRMNRWLLVLLYLLAFILLWEWLLPIVKLTEMGYMSLFLLFIILAFTLVLVGAKWPVTAMLKITYIFAVVHYIYIGTLLFTSETIRILLADIVSNFGVIGSGDWNSITNPFRTILFFTLLWMTTYLIRHWIEAKRSIVLFYIMTVVFIAFIDTFSTYSANESIVRIMVTGLLLLGLLSIVKLADKHKISASLRNLTSIVSPLLLVIATSVVLIMILPKQKPIWPDPIPFLQAVVDGTGESSRLGGHPDISKSGYGPDDSLLGGPFVEDHSLVFEAEVDANQYWKIETKSTYTSKGWDQPNYEEDASIYFPDMMINENKPEGAAESEDVKFAKLHMTSKFPFIIYPYGMMRVLASDDVSLVHLVESGQYRTRIGNVEASLDEYEIEFANYEYSLKALRETKMSELESLEGEFIEYLQLPDGLPERVGELAESITASNENVYDKTKAVERYFSKSGFTYNKKDVAIPGEDDDYVDQFLFDTKKGYCDNFSTSMVVMLRTIGIPARWVKGFAPGELVGKSNDKQTYRVTNNEAHSWVEAYMPGIGWMPFEPTIGFNGQTNIDYDIELDRNDPEIPEMPERKQKELEQEKSSEAATENKPVEFSKALSAFKSWIGRYIWWLVVGIGVLLLVGWISFVRRRKWLPKVLISLYESDRKDWDSYEKQYKSLLKQLDRFGLKRKSGDTLLAYAVQVDEHFGEKRMQELTKAYEKGIYGGELIEHDWQRLQKLWEDLMNRTSD